MKYPIAEIFTSIQGEGFYTGAVMTFVRFAGCSVGKKLTEEERVAWGLKETARPGAVLPVYVEKCCSFDGHEFLCDTDFRTKEVLTLDEITARVPPNVMHVSVTGGEPLNFDLFPLYDWCRATGRMMHIETSGTVPIERAFRNRRYYDRLWLTVSPKRGCLSEMVRAADQLKFLVNTESDALAIQQLLAAASLPRDRVFEPPAVQEQKPYIYIMAINHEKELDWANVEACKNIVLAHPEWRVTMQVHKILGVR